jgi:hypothetical protein
MSVNKDQLWTDLTSQLVGWIKSGCTPNIGGKMFATGYGGPNKPNEETTPVDFFAVRDLWKGLTGPVSQLSLTLNYQVALGKGESLRFAVNPSKSGYDTSSTCDFVGILEKTEKRGQWDSTSVLNTFAYHINVLGIKGCGGPQASTVTTTPTPTPTPTTTTTTGT